MFTTIYIYRVKRDRVDSFTEISEQISELYLANGALGDTTYQAENMNGNHGCAGMLDILDVDANEMVFLQQSLYRNKSHYEEVAHDVENNTAHQHLFEEFKHIIEWPRTISASFTTDD